MPGMVLGIHFPDSNSIPLVDNTKFKTRAIKYVHEYGREFKRDNPRVNLGEILKNWENSRRIPPHPCVPQEIWRWIRPRWQEEGIDPKHDHYGVPAGKIDQHWIDQFPDNFFDYAMAGEFVEETGRSIVKTITNSSGKVDRFSLFKRLFLLVSQNRETGIYDYEHYFFHVVETVGEWNKLGYEGETEAPEIIQIKNLYLPNYRDRDGKWPSGGIDLYPKHAFGVKACLRELVHNQGREEYRKSLEHMEKFFPREAKDVGLIQELEVEPTLNLNDEEMWDRFTKGIKKI